MGTDQLLELLLELETLDRVPRVSYSRAGVPKPQSLSEHSYHVVFLVWLLGRQMHELDLPRALELALLAYLPAIRLGALPRGAGHYFIEDIQSAAKAAAIDDLMRPLVSEAKDRYRELLEASSREARLVNACDKLQELISAANYERAGVGDFEEAWESATDLLRCDIPVIRALITEMRERGLPAYRRAQS